MSQVIALLYICNKRFFALHKTPKLIGIFAELLGPCTYGSSTPQIPCFGTDACGINQFCHIGQSQQTTVCCNRSRKLNNMIL